MTTIRIDAFDTLFFRDGKPFSMGEDAWASGIFPPPPSVFYGSLRSYYFSHHIDKLEHANKGVGVDPTQGLVIKQIGYHRLYNSNLEHLLPIPYDLFIKNRRADDEKTVEIMLLHPQKLPLSNLGHLDFGFSTSDDRSIENLGGEGFLSLRDFRIYQNGNAPTGHVENNACWRTEPKLGIAKDRLTGSSREGMLYRVGMARPATKDSYFGFSITFENLDFTKSEGFLKLGGEGKIASFETTEMSMIDLPKIEGDCFKIYFATPCIFKNGWLPDLQSGIWKEFGLKITGVATGKPISLGGFDMKNGPKPMKKALPAGSVYYVEAAHNVENAVLAIHGKCISDERAEQGFGLAYISSVQRAKL
jgi:CRISPR-associated protein Cmr3